MMQMVASMAPETAPESRTITGMVLPWGKPGYTSTGEVTVTAGAVQLPADLKRVKLLRDHSTEPGFTPVGYATAAEDTPEGLKMTFKVGATSDGDTALTDVSEGIRDALSVELVDTEVTGGVLTAGVLTAVALVPIPAFADARVERFTASRKEPKTMTNTETTTPKVEDRHRKDDPAPETPQPNEEPRNDDEEKEENVTTRDDVSYIAAARVPTGLTVTGPGRAQLTFSQAVEAIAAARTGVASAEMTAKLADITRSANPAISAPMWLGEMWEGVEYKREIIPTMTQKALTKLKGVGFRWTKKPEVGDYAGDKAEIPTGTVATEPVEVTASRMAAGHDIDRAYFDFHETEFLQAFFRARANDYAIKTDEKAAKFLVASAKTGTTIEAEPDLLHAAARARLVIKRQTRVEPNAYLVHPNSLFGLFQITQLDNPAYLDLLGVRPDRFIASDLVPEGEIIAYAKQAVTWFELSGSPIRVDAERLDHGGKDSGIFGYWATLLNQQDGIVRVPFGATKPAPRGAEREES
ncbi:hypothetical protein [Corynebacterium mastitidis]|uniref:phage major capsid protein n=1 Tax=Corynebacterium mastitidis TaxID=161890 RepID=UPI002551A3A4|nr:hypothetical protein [Corynebacterium mastitidis]MDK8450895.1 hypothetical protein [Corynebacterium mastitidis]